MIAITGPRCVPVRSGRWLPIRARRWAARSRGGRPGSRRRTVEPSLYAVGYELRCSLADISTHTPAHTGRGSRVGAPRPVRYAAMYAPRAPQPGTHAPFPQIVAGWVAGGRVLLPPPAGISHSATAPHATGSGAGRARVQHRVGRSAGAVRETTPITAPLVGWSVLAGRRLPGVPRAAP